MSHRIESLLRLIADFNKFHALDNHSAHLQEDELSVEELEWVSAAGGEPRPT